jgi:hypothetical protein
MKIIFVAFLLFLRQTCLAQNDSSIFLAVLLEPVVAYGTNTVLPENTTVAIGSRIIQNDGNEELSFWRICYNGKKLLIPVDEKIVYMADSCFVYLTMRGEDGADFRDELACANDIFLQLHKKKEKELGKYGLIIEDWVWGYENEYSYSTYCNVTVKNTAKKTIKYLWFDFIAYDAVNERLTSYGRKVEKVKGIGPIEPGGAGTYNFDSVFHSRVVNEMSITSVIIQYMDGTKKIITPAIKVIR